MAEFVEDRATEAVLKEIGVDWAQGYYYGKPTLVNYLGPKGQPQALAPLRNAGDT